MGCRGTEKLAAALKYLALLSAWAGALLLNGCSTQGRADAAPPPPPLIIAPLEKNSGSWQVAASEPGAKPAGSPEVLAEKQEANTSLRVTVGSDESSREDRFTGGRIERAQLQPNDPRLAITINIPAFRLTLWQHGKEVKTYPIGIGRRDFPLPTGEREATSIIFNPRWVPPDSEWVRQSGRVQPFEQIEPDDPRNPLGKIKIPLGDAYLIHQAAKPTDIGHLVSHGCARLLKADLFDLVEKILAARGLSLSREEIEQVRTTSERKVVQLSTPLPVDLNYDTQVIEGGVLHLYPDVYQHGTNTVEKLREELLSNGLSDLPDDETLRRMLKRVSRTKVFLVSLSDIRAGRHTAPTTER